MNYKNWYKEANQLCIWLSLQSGYSLEQCVGVVVSLSGQKRWELNQSQAEQIIFDRKVTGFHSKAQIKSAKRILAGEEPLEVWAKTSLKYRQFYACILCPTCPESVCIDSIMIRWYKDLYKSSKLHSKSLSQIFSSQKLYSIIQNAVRREAKKRNVLPLECQAIIWCEMRGAAI